MRISIEIYVRHLVKFIKLVNRCLKVDLHMKLEHNVVNIDVNWLLCDFFYFLVFDK